MRRALLWAAVALALAPAAARAAVAETTFYGTAGDGSYDVAVAAGPGEANDLRARVDGALLILTDDGAPFTPGAGCASRTPNEVQCGQAGYARSDFGPRVTLGDGDDRADLGSIGGQLAGGPGDDRLAGARSLIGGEGTDILRAGTIRASMDGGPGEDVLRGGPGDDSLTGGDGSDLLDGGPGEDAVDYYQDPRVVVDLADPGPDGPAGARDRLRAVETIYGSSHADVLLGGPGADHFLGNNGDDRIDGRGGDDVLDGENGNDRVAGGAGSDAAYGGGEGDVVTGGPGDDVLGGGADPEDGGDGTPYTDVVRGGPGADDLTAAGSASVASAGPGDDRVHAAADTSTVRCGAGTDTADALGAFRVMPATCERARLAELPGTPVLGAHVTPTGRVRTYGSIRRTFLVTAGAWARRRALGGERTVRVRVPRGARRALTLRVAASRFSGTRAAVRLRLHRGR